MTRSCLQNKVSNYLGQVLKPYLKELDHVEFWVGLFLFCGSSAKKFCRIYLIPIVVLALKKKKKKHQTLKVLVKNEKEQQSKFRVCTRNGLKAESKGTVTYRKTLL